MVFNIYSNKLENIFFSFNPINSLVLIGESEQIILGARTDGVIDVFNLHQSNHTLYSNFDFDVNITKDSGNEKNSLLNNRENKLVNNTNSKKAGDALEESQGNEINLNSKTPEFKLNLPTFSQTIHNYPLVKLKRQILMDTSTSSRIYRIFSLDTAGKFIISEISESEILEYNRSRFTVESDKPLLKITKTLDIKYNFSRIYCVDSLRCQDFDVSKQNQDIFILTNTGLLKESYEGSYVLKEVISNTNEGNLLTAFSVADTGHIITAFKDLLIRIYDERNLSVVFQFLIRNISPESRINLATLANVVVKNEKQRLERKNLITNVFILTSNNEFLIFDLNQDGVNLKVSSCFSVYY